MRGLIRRLTKPILWKLYRWYYSKQRWSTIGDLQICLYPSVFHPKWMLTTKTFAAFAQRTGLANKKVLELGAGSGYISLVCAQSGAAVTATDINPAAIKAIRESAHENGLNVSTYLSDLFDEISKDLLFDFILINPPFYPEAPKNDEERAFYCGTDFEYFHKLHQQLLPRINNGSRVFMILTDDCDLKRIREIATEHGISYQLKEQSKVLGEQHFIFELVLH